MNSRPEYGNPLALAAFRALRHLKALDKAKANITDQMVPRSVFMKEMTVHPISVASIRILMDRGIAR